jgi:hypothetical protein
LGNFVVVVGVIVGVDVVAVGFVFAGAVLLGTLPADDVIGGFCAAVLLMSELSDWADNRSSETLLLRGTEGFQRSGIS